MRRHATRGQSLGEYAILFAIVLGAAIAIQNIVKTRLQGAVIGVSDAYTNAATGAGGYGAMGVNATTDSASNSGTNYGMTSATTGTVTLGSSGNTNRTETW